MSVSSTDDRRGIEFALTAAHQLLKSMASTHLKDYEPLAPAVAYEHLAARAVPQTLSAAAQAEALVRAVPRLLAEGPFEIPPQYDGSFTITPPPVEGVPKIPRDRFVEEIDVLLTRMTNGHPIAEPPAIALQQECDRVADVISRARHHLPDSSSKWELICKCEQLQNKAERGICYIVTLGHRTLEAVTPTELFPHGPRALDTALRARRVNLELRHSILHLTNPQKVAEQSTVLQAARELLDRFFERSEYGELRSQDRFGFQTQRAAIAVCLDSDTFDPKAANSLLQELPGFANGLAGINNRAILRHHDRQARDAATRNLRALASGEATMADTLEVLRSMAGRDAPLDRIVERVATLPKRNQASHTAEILSRLRELEI